MSCSRPPSSHGIGAAFGCSGPGRADIALAARRYHSMSGVSVSNSLSGGDWELDEVSAMGDPAHVAQIGNGLRVSTDESRRRVSLQ